MTGKHHNILHETQFAGPVSLFAMYTLCNEVCIEAFENYQKRSYRSRYIIAGPNGEIQLSIPLLKGKNEKKPIKDVEISYQHPWITQHIHTLSSAYGRAAFFHHYSSDLFEILKMKYPTLYILNWEMINWIIKSLRINIKLSESKEYISQPKHLIDMRNRFSFKARQSKVEVPFYNQVFEDRFGFISDVSILDLLFCLGPTSLEYLQHYAVKSWYFKFPDFE
ncbi:MAG TPA: WbqC family protein [Saprospiraceae bacterium]|nr:WbqC family protein [Saprospiraceae bacterium]